MNKTGKAEKKERRNGFKRKFLVREGLKTGAAGGGCEGKMDRVSGRRGFMPRSNDAERVEGRFWRRSDLVRFTWIWCDLPGARVGLNRQISRGWRGSRQGDEACVRCRDEERARGTLGRRLVVGRCNPSASGRCEGGCLRWLDLVGFTWIRLEVGAGCGGRRRSWPQRGKTAQKDGGVGGLCVFGAGCGETFGPETG